MTTKANCGHLLHRLSVDKKLQTLKELTTVYLKEF